METDQVESQLWFRKRWQKANHWMVAAAAGQDRPDQMYWQEIQQSGECRWGLEHSDNNVHRTCDDPRRTKWIVKIHPALKRAKSKNSRKVMQEQAVAARNHRITSWAASRVGDSGIAQINSRKARYLIEGGVLGLDLSGTPTYQELASVGVDAILFSDLSKTLLTILVVKRYK